MHTQQHGEPVTGTGGGIKVLLIEDNPGDARLIKTMLAESGPTEFDVPTAKTLQEGISLFHSDGVQCVLLDLSLPDSRGVDTYVRLHEHAPHVPVIILTGLSDQTVALETVQRGAQDYLVKGAVGPEQLQRVVRYAVERGTILAQLHHSQETLRSTKLHLERALNSIHDDLEMANVVQRSFLPSTPMSVLGIETAGAYSPSITVGGDLFDVLPIDERRVAFLVLDVAGHGVSAALICAMAKVSFSRHISGESSPSLVFERVNAELRGYLPPSLYLTAFLCLLDMNTMTLRFSSAGHPASALVRAGRDVTYLKTKGSLIGLVSAPYYVEGTVRLNGGDKILMYTDGLIESFRDDGLVFGKQRLDSMLHRTGELSPQRTVEAIVGDHTEFIGESSQKDDITLLCFRLP